MNQNRFGMLLDNWSGHVEQQVVRYECLLSRSATALHHRAGVADRIFRVLADGAFGQHLQVFAGRPGGAIVVGGTPRVVREACVLFEGGELTAWATNCPEPLAGAADVAGLSIEPLAIVRDRGADVVDAGQRVLFSFKQHTVAALLARAAFA